MDRPHEYSLTYCLRTLEMREWIRGGNANCPKAIAVVA
jgi:hypothetical protein